MTEQPMKRRSTRTWQTAIFVTLLLVGIAASASAECTEACRSIEPAYDWNPWGGGHLTYCGYSMGENGRCECYYEVRFYGSQLEVWVAVLTGDYCFGIEVTP